ncbi:MAG: DUF1800 domain-containing protein, partial [Deltaproteobacteria bacterium]
MSLGIGGRVRHGIPWILGAVLAAACARQARKDVTPPLAADAPQAAAGAAAEQDPEAGPPLSAQEQIEHALSRVTFGARPADKERVSRIGVAAFLEEQLHPEQIADGAVEEQVARFPVLRRSSAELAQELARYRKQKKEDKARATATAMPSATMDADPVAEAPDPNLPAAALPRAGQRDLRKQLGKAGRGPAFDMVAQLAQAKLVRAIGSERQLHEVMAEFWFNHFNVFAGKQNEAALLPAYEQQIRELALG